MKNNANPAIEDRAQALRANVAWLASGNPRENRRWRRDAHAEIAERFKVRAKENHRLTPSPIVLPAQQSWELKDQRFRFGIGALVFVRLDDNAGAYGQVVRRSEKERRYEVLLLTKGDLEEIAKRGKLTKRGIAIRNGDVDENGTCTAAALPVMEYLATRKRVLVAPADMIEWDA